MLKSTHKSVSLPALPEGWTEHKAPSGHSYYYNTATKQSTYTRPAPPTPAAAVVQAPLNPGESFLQYQSVGNRPQFGADSVGLPAPDGGRGGFHGRGGRGGHDRSRETRPQPTDKPISRHPIPDCEPWILVNTKLGRRFVYNTQKDQSYWRIPDKLRDGIMKLDQLRIKEKAEALNKAKQPVDSGEAPGASGRPVQPTTEAGINANEDSSEYEEVEVTDDEDDENPSKRQRTEEAADDQRIEFNEDDIAFQLAAMGQEYGLEPAEYGDENMGEWEEGAEGLEMNPEDSSALFKDLLNDFGINPYSPWEKLVEEGKLVDDIRYTALSSMRARKEVWDEWSREKIQSLKELRTREEKQDPRIQYLAFLQKHATPKLYWPEFKRKFKRESEMRELSMADRDREKLYRDHINRLKLPQSTLKSDLATLLKLQPLRLLNSATLSSHLPSSVLTDIRYVSLDPTIRDPLVEAYISTLPPPPEAVADDETGDMQQQRLERVRRERALEERAKQVAEQKRQQRRDLDYGKGRLREEEAEISRAMNVTKKGLKNQLMDNENNGAE